MFMSHVLASVPTQVASQQPAIVSKEKPALTFIAAKHGHNARRRIEAFIASGFKARYNARVTSFMPMLFALDAKGVKAAAGARFAAYDGQYNSLFIEQYLNTSVETALTLQGITVNRAHIAEVGNLFSSASRYTLPLLFALFFVLKRCGSKYLVFSATSQLTSLLMGAGIQLLPLVKADASKLKGNSDDWGTYYDTAPQVTALSLHHVTQHIIGCPELNAHYQRAIELISANVDALTQNICTKKETAYVA
jgi:hypothetical protein